MFAGRLASSPLEGSITSLYPMSRAQEFAKAAYFKFAEKDSQPGMFRYQQRLDFTNQDFGIVIWRHRPRIRRSFPNSWLTSYIFSASRSQTFALLGNSLSDLDNPMPKQTL
jgi:hypothetical protein